MSLGGGSPKIITLNSENWVHSSPNHFLLNIDCCHRSIIHCYFILDLSVEHRRPWDHDHIILGPLSSNESSDTQIGVEEAGDDANAEADSDVPYRWIALKMHSAINITSA